MADPIDELLKMSVDERSQLRWDDSKLDVLAERLEKKYEMPEGTLRAIKFAENTGYKDGKISLSNNTSTAVSSAKAKGLMQFIPDTMKRGFEHNPLDPVESMDAAARLLSSEAKRMKNNWAATFAQYNGGTSQGNLVMQGKKPTFKETETYLKKIEAYYTQNTKGR
jgi:hypothetical protein